MAVKAINRITGIFRLLGKIGRFGDDARTARQLTFNGSHMARLDVVLDTD
jgi:hypothetical protein